jgi:hypothetical protein
MKLHIASHVLCSGLALLLSGCSVFNGAFEKPVPPGAAALGYTKCVIDERPAVTDITADKNGSFKWFSGQWYSAKPPTLDHYRMVDGVLALKLNGDLVSAPRDFSAPGRLPALPGDKGFYVEFEVRLSDSDPDHWPAVWLMPWEHNSRQEDHYEGDPKGFERFMELDVDEGGFGPGLTGTVHSWFAIWPKYQHVQNPNNVLKTPLDRSQRHTFGASYDPLTKTATWWVDGVRQMSATSPYVPDIAARQRFYLIIGAQSHGKNTDYLMFVSAVRAYVPPTSPLPAATMID